MAHCGSRCPYYWHDEDCEYCRARGNEIIDLKNYSYDTCPYYKGSGGGSSRTSGSQSGSSFWGLVVWVLIIGGLLKACGAI